MLSCITPYNDRVKTIVSELFWIATKKASKQSSLLAAIMSRKSAQTKLSGCQHYVCCRDKKLKRILDIGEASIDKEFDVISFVKL
jgi:hypothetical protein